MRVQELVADSLAYERAITFIEPTLKALNAKKRRAERNADNIGGAVDSAYGIALKALKTTLDELRHECDRLWEAARADANYYAKAADRLCEAVIVQAAHDYETALSYNDTDAMDSIEEFASQEAETYTQMDMLGILSRIRKGQAKFAEKARAEFDDIIVETQLFREQGIADFSIGKHKCPLCGGAMFVSGEVRDRLVTIRCTGCSLFEQLNPEAERRKRSAERH